MGLGGGFSGCATNQFATSRIGTVVVVGAGIAGLTAARDLQRAGYGVVVLEGQDRLGGRIHTDHSLGVPIELGADRTQGIKKNPIFPLIDESGIKYVPFEWDNLSGVSSIGEPLDVEKLSTSKPDLMKMLTRAFIRNLGRAGDATVAEIVEKEKRLRRLTLEEMEILNFSLGTGEIMNGASFERTSWKFIREFEGYNGDDQFVVNGYDAVPKLLAQDLDIRKNQNVQAIDYTGPGVRVTTQKTTFEADFAVVTVSLGVLKAGAIKFLPDLPWRKNRAIGRMGMGQLNKIALRYPKQFWPMDNHGLAHGSDDQSHFPAFINIARYTNEPVLLTMAPEGFRNAMAGLSEEATVREVHAVLQGMYGADIPEPTRAIRSNWDSDPFTLGSFSFNEIGAKGQDRNDLAAPVEGRLFFAGEATHRKKFGSVSGAYVTGQRVAREVFGATVTQVST
jgi:monoamine oxidase